MDDEEIKSFRRKLKLKERAYTTVVCFALVFLAAVIVYAIAMLVKDYKKTKFAENTSMIEELERTSNHRIFYDTETGVMYVEYTSHGGISPMYNPDGSLRVYEETN